MPKRVDILVGSRVRDARITTGLSQSELGDLIGGISFQQVQKYEKGTNRIGASRLWEIAKALNVPVHSFFENLEEYEQYGTMSRRAIAMADDLLSMENEDLKAKIVALIKTAASEQAA